MFPWLHSGETPPNKGVKLSEERKQSLSKAKKALVASGWKPWNYGKRMSYTKEHRAKLRENLLKSIAARRFRKLGDRVEGKDGYISIYLPSHASANSVGYVHEHRVVAERALGRKMGAEELVHHVNGNKKDNRPKNLIICSRSYHNYLHNKMSSLFQDIVFGEES